MIRSKITSLSNTYHYYFFLFLLILLIAQNQIFIFISTGYFLFIFQKSNKKLLCIVGLTATITLLAFNFSEASSSIIGKVIVTNVKANDGYYQVEIWYLFKKYLFTHNNDAFSVGDILAIKADVNTFKGLTVRNGFNAKEYYLGHNIYGKLDIHMLKKENHLFNLKDLLMKLSDNLSPKGQAYFHAFLFGEKRMLDDQLHNMAFVNISAVLGLSLIHIYGIKKGLSKLLFYLDIKRSHQKILLFSVDIFFLLITNFSYLSLRLITTTVISKFNADRHLSLTNLDIKSVTLSIILLFNPYLIMDMAFLLSLTILLQIEFNSDFYGSKNVVLRELKLSILIFLSAFPFITNFTNSISIIAIIAVMILKPIVKYLIYPLIFILILLPFMVPIIDPFLVLFEEFLNYLLFYNLAVKLPSINEYLFFIYYLLLIIWHFFTKVEWRSLYSIVAIPVFFLLFFISVKQDDRIVFLDVGQGDSTIISYHNQVIVIDAFSGCYQYLLKNGFHQIDLLILTHSDTDHTKDAKEIIDNLDVKRIIGNPYDQYLDIIDIDPMSAYDEINFNDIDILFYGPLKKYRDSNNNSLIFKIIFTDFSVLFPGDMEDLAEADIINEYKDRLQCDIYKLTHHGSNTKNKEDFLAYAKPQIVIISVGANNWYHLPNIEVINFLHAKGIKYYRTDNNGSIEYSFSDKQIFTYM